MAGLPGFGVYISEIASREDRLADALVKASDEVAHVECFDDEERSEIYTILQAIRSGTETHRTAIDLLARKLDRGVGDA